MMVYHCQFNSTCLVFAFSCFVRMSGCKVKSGAKYSRYSENMQKVATCIAVNPWLHNVADKIMLTANMSMQLVLKWSQQHRLNIIATAVSIWTWVRSLSHWISSKTPVPEENRWGGNWNAYFYGVDTFCVIQPNSAKALEKRFLFPVVQWRTGTPGNSNDCFLLLMSQKWMAFTTIFHREWQNNASGY